MPRRAAASSGRWSKPTLQVETTRGAGSRSRSAGLIGLSGPVRSPTTSSPTRGRPAHSTATSGRSSRTLSSGKSGSQTRTRPVTARPTLSEAASVARVAPGERGLQALLGGDAVELPLLRRVHGVQDRREVEIRLDGCADAHGLVGAPERELREAERGERCGRDLPHELLHGALELLLRDDAVDETDPVRLLRVDRVAGEEELVRLLLAEHERHDERHRTGAVADLGLAEARVLRCNDEVARHGELAGAGEAPTPNRRDRRLLEAPELHREVYVVLEHPVPALRALDLVCHLLADVVPGREGAPGTGQDDDLHAVVFERRAHRGEQAVHDRLVEGVQLLGTGEGDPRGRPAGLLEDR